MALVQPGPTNVYVPFFNIQGGLIVAFARNPAAFPLNLYCQVVPTDRMVGKYLYIDPAQAGRITDKTLNQFAWPDGQPAPQGNWAKQEFEFRDYATQRYVYPWALGFQTVQQASWDIINSHAHVAAQQAMTARAIKVFEALNSASWGNNTVASSGDWGNGTATNPIIKKTVNAAAKKILQSTVGAVNPRDMILVVNPNTATKMAESQEVHTYLKESVPALEVLRGTISDGEQLYRRNAVWGLPPTLYGYKLVVEDTVVVSTAKKAGSTTTEFVMPDGVAYLLSRPGGLEGLYGHPTFSTVVIFTYRPEEMLPEHMTDQNNRLHLGRVIDNFAAVVVAPAAGVKITGV